ncbi:MAG TPA: hypothetical protein VJU84_08685 [Pyrinomonadaceae bacterium]|nr:hypothetical protein [Pyrinomonadaceae bacterium]
MIDKILGRAVVLMVAMLFALNCIAQAQPKTNLVGLSDAAVVSQDFTAIAPATSVATDFKLENILNPQRTARSAPIVLTLAPAFQEQHAGRDWLTSRAFRAMSPPGKRRFGPQHVRPSLFGSTPAVRGPAIVLKR